MIKIVKIFCKTCDKCTNPRSALKTKLLSICSICINKYDPCDVMIAREKEKKLRLAEERVKDNEYIIKKLGLRKKK